MPRLGLDTNDPEEDTSARRSEDGDSEREDAPEVADDAEEVVVVAAENAEDGVLGPEEESIPTRGDENSMLFQILISSRELWRCPRVPYGFAAHETGEVEALPSLHILFLAAPSENHRRIARVTVPRRNRVRNVHCSQWKQHHEKRTWTYWKLFSEHPRT